MRAAMRCLSGALMIACASGPVASEAAPHTRTGFCAGIGFGMESVSWTDEDGDRGAEGSGATNARVGWAIKPDLVLGLEFWGWAKDYEIGTHTLPVPVDVKLAATTLCVTYYPGNAGFFARLGAGYAYGRIGVEPPSSVTEVPAVKESKGGLAVDIAPGYEWRLSERFALGAQGDIVYLGLGEPLENAFGYGLSAQFNWYW
jgi:hypothetical protein